MIQEQTLPLGKTWPLQVAPSGCIHQLFESQALKLPNSVAVTCCSRGPPLPIGTATSSGRAEVSSPDRHAPEILTYRELNEKANRLARYLRNLGVTVETPVSLYLDRSPWMVVAILAVLKAG